MALRSRPMPIVPDTKDWTWVVDRRCPECGFDGPAVRAEDVAGLIRANAQAWRAVLAAGGSLDQRPDGSTWSPLEYACHVRDVYRLYDYRLGLMLTRTTPRSRTGTRTPPPSRSATTTRTRPWSPS